MRTHEWDGFFFQNEQGRKKLGNILSSLLSKFCNTNREKSTCGAYSKLLLTNTRLLKQLVYAEMHSALCKKGYSPSCMMLSAYYDVVRKSPQQSYVYANRACELGEKNGCIGCWVLSERYKSIRASKAALRAMENMCASGDSTCCASISKSYYSNVSAHKNIDKAIYFSKRGCFGRGKTVKDSCFLLEYLLTKKARSCTCYERDGEIIRLEKADCS